MFEHYLVERLDESKRAEPPKPVPPTTAQLCRPTIQARMIVGKSMDPYEREADRVADDVVRRLVQRSDIHDDIGGGGDHPRRDVRIQRAARGPSNPAGGPVGEVVEQRIRRAAGSGRALDDATRDRMEQGFGTDFGRVRIHTGPESAVLNRRVGALAFTTGNDIHFGGGQYRPNSHDGQRLLAHELTHTIQQGGGQDGEGRVRRSTMTASPRNDRAATDQTRVAVSAVSDAGTVQRHSSWEHMLIGDLLPEELAILGAAYDVSGPNDSVDTGHGTIEREQVVHVIQQEIERLKYFQTDPPAIDDERQIEAKRAELVGNDTERRLGSAMADPDADGIDYDGLAALFEPEWDLQLVAVPNKSGRKFLVTYGELNTLADFFGSLEEMNDMDEGWVDRLIRSVRKSQMNELLRVFAMVQGLTSDPLTQKDSKTDRQKAMAELGLASDDFLSASGGSDAFELVGVQAELSLMGKIPTSTATKPTVNAEASTDYSSTLARNACHFAPESWHTWADYHNKARALALRAYAERQRLHDVNLDGNDRTEIEKNAATLANGAMLTNGFGDHYLQDSYAAGHLINKTLIMQWYVKWIDSDKSRWKAHRDANWQKVQQMAYGQSGLTDAGQYSKDGVGQNRQIDNQSVPSARNPQTVENISGDWKLKAKALGLQVPGSLTGGTNTKKMLIEWQSAIVNFKAPEMSFANAWKWVSSEVRATKPVDMKVSDLVTLGKGINMSADDVKKALAALFDDGIIVRAKFDSGERGRGPMAWNTLGNRDEFVLRDVYVPTDKNRFDATSGDDDAFQSAALGVTYSEYLEFMNSGYLQKATNTLHDEFCEKGLDVYSGDNHELFKVYGDNAMLEKSSSAGLKHSGETAHRSRNAILDLTTKGQAADTTDTILDRVPADVRWNGVDMSLAQWHGNGGSLQQFCEGTLFPALATGIKNTVFNKLAPGLFGGDLGTISKNPPHAGEIF